jgi:hypothetical protein
VGNHFLKSQLTTAKQASPMWAGLADAVQQIFDSQVKPLSDRIAALNSYFTMHKDDLQKRLDEMGSFFYFSGNINQADMPLAVMQKLDEIHFKRTDLPIKNAISREFQGLKVDWAALYAPKVITPDGSTDYTKKLYNGALVNALRTKAEISDNSESVSDYFLTSRGVLLVSSTLLASSGYEPSEFSLMVERIITPLVPTDIVFDGEQILIHYDIIEPLERLFYYEQTVTEIFNAIHDPKVKITGKPEVLQAGIMLNNRAPEITGYMNRIDAISLDFWPLDIIS